MGKWWTPWRYITDDLISEFCVAVTISAKNLQQLLFVAENPLLIMQYILSSLHLCVLMSNPFSNVTRQSSSYKFASFVSQVSTHPHTIFHWICEFSPELIEPVVGQNVVIWGKGNIYGGEIYFYKSHRLSLSKSCGPFSVMSSSSTTWRLWIRYDCLCSLIHQYLSTNSVSHFYHVMTRQSWGERDWTL